MPSGIKKYADPKSPHFLGSVKAATDPKVLVKSVAKPKRKKKKKK